MKKILKQTAIYASVLFASSCLLLAVAYGLASVSLNFADYLFPAYPIAGVNVARAEVSDMPLRLWAMNYANDNKIDPIKFDCLINGESRWNVNAYNINKNGSVDLGLLQWNTQHIKSGYISLECVSDPICAVKRAIEKIKKDGNMNAWVAAKSCK